MFSPLLHYAPSQFDPNIPISSPIPIYFILSSSGNNPSLPYYTPNLCPYTDQGKGNIRPLSVRLQIWIATIYISVAIPLYAKNKLDLPQIHLHHSWA